MELIVVGDDLTGCNATAMMFRALGWRVNTLLRHDVDLHNDAAIGQRAVETQSEPSILVWNSGSRLLDKTGALARLEPMLGQIQPPLRDSVRFAKRIDSTFRGPVGYETEFMLRHISRDAVAVVVAAFPASGRQVQEGRLYVHGDPVDRTELARDPHTPIHTSHIADLLSEETSLPMVHLSLRDLNRLEDGESVEQTLDISREGHLIIICDATNDSDIEKLARVFADWSRPILPVDPGPFTVAYMSALQKKRNRVLVVSGSVMATMTKQLNHLEHHFGLKLLDVDVGELQQRVDDPLYLPDLARTIATHFATGNVAGFRTDRQISSSQTIVDVSLQLAELTRRVMDQVHITGLYVSGGEVAYEVLDTLDAGTLEPICEIAPLCILSRITSGPVAGLRVVTKGGSVGPEDVVAKSVELLLSGTEG